MKLILFLPALAMGILAANANLAAHEIKALLGRAIDPKTMDATQLSVLSVLRTAMPTGPDTPLPTGDFEPEWYQKLPADVKSLLPSLYPEAAATVDTTTTTTTTTRTTTVTTRKSTSAQGGVVSQTPVVSSAASATSTPAAPSASLLLPTISAVLVSSALANISGVSNDNSPAMYASVAAPAIASTVASSSSSPTPSLLWTPRFNITQTAQDVLPTATAAANATTAPGATGFGSGSANGTLSIAAPLPSEFFGTGTKSGVKMGVLAAVMWVGVGMGFCIFA